MTFGTEFWSAICGAVVGGVIALCIQLIALRAAKMERNEQKKERRDALGHSIVFKVMRIHSNFYQLHFHLEEAFASVDSQSHGEPWSFVLPLANTPDDVHFSPDEMSLILSFGSPELTDSLMSLDVVHNSLIDIFETYAGMRADILPLMPAEMVGGVGKSTLTKEQLKVARPRMVMMNRLISDTRGRAEVDYLESKKAVQDLFKSLNDKLGLKIKLEINADKLDKLDKIKQKSKVAKE